MEKAVIYARVSSKEQEQSGYSIPAQIKYLSEYAEKQKLNIVQIFSESMSAKDINRIVFDDMFKFLKKNKDVTHIIVEKNDRLLRNDFDNAKIIKIATTTDLSFHLTKENLILNKNSTPQDILFFTINSAFSSYYPRNLSNEVKKGTFEKAQQGLYPRPSLAPMGYKKAPYSTKGTPVIIDEEVSPFIIKIFKLYSTGNYSLRRLADKMTEEGFYVSNKPCTKSRIEKILGQPFYIGEFNYCGQRFYNALHEPLISKELFYLCQSILKSGGQAKPKTKDFLYRGLIKCKNCGGVLSGEIKKGKYIYYRCTRTKEKGCNSKPLKADYIDEFILDILKGITIPPEKKEIIINSLKKKHKNQVEYDESVTIKIETQTKVLKNRLNKLYIDKLDGTVNDDFYFENREKWQIELDKLEMQRNDLRADNTEFMRKANNFLELCENLYLWYFKQSNEEKRNVLNIIVSNFSYNGQKLSIELKSTFETMFKSANFKNGGHEETRTPMLSH